MGKTALIILLLTIFSTLIGFIRDIVLAFYYGASNISDAYLISMAIPGEVFALIGAGIATSYIPIYSYIQNEVGTRFANHYTNNVINIVMVISTALVLIGMLFTEFLVKIFASGFEGETLSLAVTFTRISIVSIYFIGIIKILSGFLQINGNFSVPALMAIPMNLFVILSIYISYPNNIHLLAMGSLVGILFQLLMLLRYVYKKGFKYKFVLNFKDPHIQKMAIIALPVILGESVNQINVIVDKTIASHMVMGGISILNYSNRINQFIQSVFVISIITALFPMISKMASENNLSELKKNVAEALRIISLLVFPVSIGVMLFSKPIIEVLYGRGAFDTEAIRLTSSSLTYYSIGMLGMGVRDVLSKVFFSLQDTKTPMINAVISVIINIILNIVLSRFIGVGGLALATSISAIIAAILLLMSLQRKIHLFHSNSLTYLLKILIAAILVGLIAKTSYLILLYITNNYLAMFTSIALAVLIYIVILYLLDIKDVKLLFNILKGKLRRN